MNGINGIGNAFQPIQHQQEQRPRPQPQPEAQQPAAEAAPAATYSSEAEYNPHVMQFADGSQAAEPQAPPPQPGSEPESSANQPADVSEPTAANPSASASSPVSVLSLANAAYTDAKGAQAALDAELAMQLAIQGTNLTDAQKQAYVDEYMQSHPEYADTDAAAAELQAALNDPAVVEAAKTDPAVATQVKDALEHLASGQHGDQALEWLEANANMVNSLGFSDTELNDLVEEAANSAAAQLEKSGNGNAEYVQEKLEKLIKSVETIAGHTGNSLLSAFATELGQFKDALKGGPDTLTAYFAKAGTEAPPKLMSFAYMFAAIGAADFPGFDDPAKLTEYLTDIATLAQGGEQAIKSAIEEYGKSDFLDTLSKHVDGRFTGFATMAVCALSAVQAVIDIDKFVSDPSLSGGLQAVSSLLAVIPAPAAQFLSAGFALAALLTEFPERNSEMEAILKNMDPPLSDEVAHALSHDPSAGTALASAGLTPEQIQELAAAAPALFESTNQGAEAFVKAAQSIGLDSDEIVDLAKDLQDADPDFDPFAYLAMQTGGDPDGLASGAALASALSGLPGASDALAAHEKNIIEQKQHAADDYAGHSYYDPDLRDLLAENGDPAYRAEMISRIKQDGALALFVETVERDGSEAEKEALADALSAAYDAGEIDNATANQHLDSLGYDAIPCKPA